MTCAEQAVLRGAKLIDYTGTVAGFKHLDKFGPDFIELVRGNQDHKAVVIIDRGFAKGLTQPMLVRDHLNLSGNNPLVGPNHPLGERFTIVQNIYVDSCLKGLTSGIAAGLKDGLVPQEEEFALLKDFAADFFCYNMVPSMLVAAHAHWKVLGIVLPENAVLSAEHLKEINELTRVA